MARKKRNAIAGVVYHVMNRANAGMPLFETDGDYMAFGRVVTQACELVPIRLLAYCFMPNHWHMVVWPFADGSLSTFMQWLGTTHVHRWQTAHNLEGRGHLYQGRFKDCPVESDRYYLTVHRYVERNALRAGLVQRAEDWRWSSIFQRTHGREDWAPPLSEGPAKLPDSWIQVLNTDQNQADLQTIRQCIGRGRPYGSASWAIDIAAKAGLESTLRPLGRPPKR